MYGTVHEIYSRQKVTLCFLLIVIFYICYDLPVYQVYVWCKTVRFEMKKQFGEIFFKKYFKRCKISQHLKIEISTKLFKRTL